jgi:hypothetical protein
MGEQELAPDEIAQPDESEEPVSAGLRRGENSSGSSPELLLAPEEDGEVLSPGLYVYLGTTQMGKTHKAVNDALATQRVTLQPLLIVDSQGAKNFRDIPHEQTLDRVIERTWGDEEEAPLVVWTPTDEDRDEGDFEKLMGAVREAGHCILLIDEVSFWASSPRLRTLFRVWAHAEVTLLVTAQNVGMDLSQSLLACNPRLFLFRITGPRSLEWGLKWLGLDPVEVRAFPPYHYIDRRL